MLKLVAGSCLVAIAASWASAQSLAPAADYASDRWADAIAKIGQDYLDADGVGLSVGITSNGKIYFYNFGAMRKNETRLPTEATVYEIGSLTKTITGLLLAQAVVDRKVDLNDEVGKYFARKYENLSFDGESVRVVHLANMTSGIPNDLPAPSDPTGRADPTPQVHWARDSATEVRANFFRRLRTVTLTEKPGFNPAHSNAAAQLLGYVLENVYGAAMEELVPRLVERPLHMDSGSATADRPRATGYDEHGKEVAASGAEAGLRYSADDMLKYVMHQLDERDAAVALSHRSTWDTLDKEQSIGFFWIASKVDGGRRLRYSGSTHGFTSFCDLYPEQRIGIVLLANNCDAGSQDRLKKASEEIDAAILATAVLR